ncbi:hypothetical protein M422DRAFT_25269 [Sphaerobolus stellatus SS14]|nr:hypothetical protein M422DRAFT_25269 [Sphaerobolus stellatus SS14]
MSLAPLLFSTIDVTRQVFYRAALSFAIVNLKPIVPGHVLIIPNRPVKRLADLSHEEVSSLFLTAREVGKVVETAYKADALTVACQDGKAAGQSIPHVHIHILPRRFKGDRFENANDDVYPAIEKSEKELPHHLRINSENKTSSTEEVDTFKVDADEDRKPRMMEEMEEEAKWLSQLFKS